MYLDKTGMTCKDMKLFESETCFCVAATSPHHQTIAAAKAQMKGVIPANIMKPKKNYQSQQSSSSK